MRYLVECLTGRTKSRVIQRNERRVSCDMENESKREFFADIFCGLTGRSWIQFPLRPECFFSFQPNIITSSTLPYINNFMYTNLSINSLNGQMKQQIDQPFILTCWPHSSVGRTSHRLSLILLQSNNASDLKKRIASLLRRSFFLFLEVNVIHLDLTPIKMSTRHLAFRQCSLWNVEVLQKNFRSQNSLKLC